MTTISGTSNSSRLPLPQPGGSVVGLAAACGAEDDVSTAAASAVADGEPSEEASAAS